MLKSGLDWFRIDVDFEDKFELVCAEFGSAAFEIIVRLWQKIYKAGYYIEWNCEVALLFAKKYSLGHNAVSEIVNCAVRRGVFDESMFQKFGILTSHGIQKWYLDSTERRTIVEVQKKYLLVDVTKINDNVNIIDENVNIKAENIDKNSHSTVHNSTVHNKKESSEPSYDFFITNYTSNNELLKCLKEFIKMRALIKKPMTNAALKLILTRLDTLASDDIKKIAIVEQSIMNCWQGIFELKKDEGYTKSKQKASENFNSCDRKNSSDTTIETDFSELDKIGL